MDETMSFNINGGQEKNNGETVALDIKDEQEKEKEREIKRVLTAVYDALKEKGYKPIRQITQYILTGEPIYITSHNNARTLIRKIERDDLLDAIVKSYLDS